MILNENSYSSLESVAAPLTLKIPISYGIVGEKIYFKPEIVPNDGFSIEII